MSKKSVAAPSMTPEERIFTFFLAACVHVGRGIREAQSSPVRDAVAFIREAREAGIIPQKGDLK